MPDSKRGPDHDESGALVEFILTFIFEGGIELLFGILRFVGHALVAMLAGVFHV